MLRPTTTDSLLPLALDPTSDSRLDCRYSAAPVERLLQLDNVLAVISSGDAPRQIRDPRHFHCGLAALSQPSLHEVWSTSGPVHSGVQDAIRWARSDDVLFLARSVEDNTYVSQREAIYQTYTSLLACVREQGYPHIARMWNYLPHINQGQQDAERYRQFCLGRQQAFTEAAYLHDTYPAACALGHQGEQTMVYLLAGKHAVIHIENPRQESAYLYPRQYGPASPSFARASLSPGPNGAYLYISGTASILGHQSRHPHNVSAQLQTTFENLEALLLHSSQQAGMSTCARMALLKIYIRNPQDYPLIEAQVKQRFPGVPALYLQGDICRRELLVEIDGFCDLGRPGAQDSTMVSEQRHVEHA